MEIMNIIGIDLGTATTGWGVLCGNNGKWGVKDYGAILTSKDKPLSERLAEIFSELQKLLQHWQIEELALEEVFFNTNGKTAMKISQAQGVVKLAAVLLKIPVFEYTPLQVKVAVTGYGRAEKRQVGLMVKKLLKLKEVPKPDDTADALAVALCHTSSRKVKIRL